LYGSAHPERRRTLRSFRMEGALEDLLDGTLRAGAGISSFSATDTLASRETLLELRAAARKDLLEELEWGSEALLRMHFHSGPLPLADPLLLSAGTEARFRPVRELDITGGLRFHLFRNADAGTSGRVFPELLVRWQTGGEWVLWARFRPEVRATDLASAFSACPYLGHSLRLRHPEVFTDITVGIEGRPGPGMHASLQAGFRERTNAPLYVPDSERGLWLPDAGGTTRVLTAETSVRMELTPMDECSLALLVEGNRNSTTGRREPYVPALTGSALYLRRFPFPLSVQAEGRYVGSRNADAAGMRRLDPVFLADVAAEYAVTGGWTAALALRNAANTPAEWWEAYQEWPRHLELSVRYAW
ncbi:MAG: hypothetical protein WB626_01495, partial [Bacteroidota bacterium]